MLEKFNFKSYFIDWIEFFLSVNRGVTIQYFEHERREYQSNSIIYVSIINFIYFDWKQRKDWNYN